jgi:predicted acyltransferase
MLLSPEPPRVETSAQPAKSPAVSAGRLTSIDALRGFDMFWIIGGGEVLGSLAQIQENRFTVALRDQMEHVGWQGCHFEDLIYPLFLFIIGIVLPFSLSRRREQGQRLGQLYVHCLTRSLLLIILGSIPGGLLTQDIFQVVNPGRSACVLWSGSKRLREFS